MAKSTASKADFLNFLALVSILTYGFLAEAPHE